MPRSCWYCRDLGEGKSYSFRVLVIALYRMQKLLNQKSLPKNLNVHSQCHTNASLMIAQGLDVRTVAGLLGHAQPSTTLDSYSHGFDKKKREPQKKLGEMMGL